MKKYIVVIIVLLTVVFLGGCVRSDIHEYDFNSNMQSASFVNAETKNAETFCALTGKVIKIVDGDTITVLGSRKKQHVIRLSGIDALEKDQPYGESAKRVISKLLYRKLVCVDWHKKDKYGRKIGTVMKNQNNINLLMINRGHAWHCKKYQKEQSRMERETYSTAELNAKQNAFGFWQDREVVPPWEWRKYKRYRIKVAPYNYPKSKATVNYICGEKLVCK